MVPKFYSKIIQTPNFPSIIFFISRCGKPFIGLIIIKTQSSVFRSKFWKLVWNNKPILFTELPKCLTFNGWYNNISRGASLLSGGVTHYLPNTDRVLTQFARHQIKSHYRRFFLPLLAIYTSKTFLPSNQALYVYTKQSETFYG